MPDGFVDLVVRRKDAQTPPLLAKKLNDLRIVYSIYGALDGLSLSYSMLKYLFDLVAENYNSSADMMHDWLMEPGGALAGAASSITLIVFSMLANHFDDGDKNLFKKYIAVVWPYCRDTMKGLKNAYKGVRSAFTVMGLAGGQNLTYLITPVGLLLGGLSIINRTWTRQMVSQRKTMMKENAQLLKEIQNYEGTLENLELLLQRIKRQEEKQKKLGLLSAAYGGVVDGLYLYIGILGLCSVSPPVLVAMTIFSSIYVIACVATRMYEEYDFQRRLHIAQAKIELAHSGKKIELLFGQLHRLSIQISDSTSENDEWQRQQWQMQQTELANQFKDATDSFEKNRDKLCSLTTLSYTSAFLAGVRNALYAYSALASVAFAIGTVLVLTATTFPPSLLIACVNLGLVFLVGFIAHSLICNYQHHSRLKLEQDIKQHRGQSIYDLLTTYKISKQDMEALQPEKIVTEIVDRAVVDPSPQFFFEEWFEVIRSFFSGVGKGSKAVILTMNRLEVPDINGHTHESGMMLGFIAISAVIHTVVLGLRAYARMGRESLEAPFVTNPKPVSLNSSATSESNQSCLESSITPGNNESCLESSITPAKGESILESPITPWRDKTRFESFITLKNSKSPGQNLDVTRVKEPTPGKFGFFYGKYSSSNPELQPVPVQISTSKSELPPVAVPISV